VDPDKTKFAASFPRVRRRGRSVRLTGDGNCREIARLLLLARDCHRRLGSEEEFATYVTALRTDQRRKRNLMKVLDGGPVMPAGPLPSRSVALYDHADPVTFRQT
jgi:hypothetical protein